MTAVRPLSGRIALVSLAVLAACSTPAPPPPPPPPPPVVPTIRPTPPDNAAEGMSVPQKTADGSYDTANRGVTSNTALWHVRMALNVAALNCDKFGSTARTQYNQILAVHQGVLGAANAAVDRNYKVAYGNAAIQSRERLNTVVYNFFALPPVIKHFCPVAVSVGAKILAMPSSALVAYAPEALAELEKPYQEFYAAYEDYLRRLAEWQSRFGASVTVIVSPTPLPPPPRPPAEVPPAGWQPGYAGSVQKAVSGAGVAKPSTPVQPLPEVSGPALSGPALSGPPAVAPTRPPVTSTPPAAPASDTPRLTVQPLPMSGE